MSGVVYTKGQRLLDSELVPGTVYYITGNGPSSWQFSGTGRFTGVSDKPTLNFTEIVPDENNGFETWHNYTQGGFDIGMNSNRIHEAIRNRIHEETPIVFPYAIGDMVSELHEMTIGKDYYVIKTPVSQFNGVAKYIGSVGEKARFCSYIPDENNLWDGVSMASHPTFDVDPHSQRIFEAIPIDKAPILIVKEEAKEEPPISLEESQRMINEIQVAYEYL